MKIAIINGPNLNLTGNRETSIYGNQHFDDFLKHTRQKYPTLEISYFQSNVEGELINEIQKAGFETQGIILNPGGYTHTSVAIGDAVAAIPVQVIEVHMSNIAAREEFRKISYVSAKCTGTITGFGLNSYDLALKYFIEQLS